MVQNQSEGRTSRGPWWRRASLPATVIGAFVIIAFAAIVASLPLYEALREAAERDIRNTAASRAQAVGQFLQGINDLADQVAGRSYDRMVLDRLRIDGGLHESQSAALHTSLNDAMRSTKTIIGARRLDATGETVAQAGHAVPRAFWPRASEIPTIRRMSEPFVLDGQVYLTVSNPIQNVNTVGTDILLISTEELLRVLGGTVARGELGETRLLFRSAEGVKQLLFDGASWTVRELGHEFPIVSRAIENGVRTVQSLQTSSLLLGLAPVDRWIVLEIRPAPEVYSTIHWQFLFVGALALGLALIATFGIFTVIPASSPGMPLAQIANDGIDPQLLSSGHPVNPWQIRLRLLLYLLLVLGVVAPALVIGNSTWRGSLAIDGLATMVSAILGGTIGIFLVAAYRRSEAVWDLTLGLGFLGMAVLDGYRALLATSLFSTAAAADLEPILSWGWTASRLLLALMLLLALWIHHRAARRGGRSHHGAAAALMAAGCLTALGIFTLALLPLPQAFHPALFISRPQDLLPAILLIAACIGILRKGGWRFSGFEHWLMLAMIAMAFGHAAYLPLSERLFDARFEAAHIWQLAALGLMVLGLAQRFATEGVRASSQTRGTDPLDTLRRQASMPAADAPKQETAAPDTAKRRLEPSAP